MSLYLNGKKYRNGTVVRANPVEQATGTLQKIGIGSDVYNITGSGTQEQADWTQTDSTAVDYIKNKPTLATVATTGDYDDLTDKPSLATVATTGDYDDLTNKPTIPAAQVQSDWSQTDNTQKDYIKNKPTLATVATSGSYADLSNKPSIPTKTSNLINDSNFVSDANYVHTDNNFTSSEKTKLSGIATGAEVNVQANWNETDNTSDAYIQNKPTLATVATSGDYDDLTDKPNLATVATSGDYDDLTNKPTIPAAQVNSDWNSSSGVSQILNKPTLATVATSGAYSDLSGTPSLATVATSGSYSDLSNKPTIPSVEANPSGTASATLSTLEVDGTIYNVPSGGGSDLPLTVENGKLCIIYET